MLQTLFLFLHVSQRLTREDKCHEVCATKIPIIILFFSKSVRNYLCNYAEEQHEVALPTSAEYDYIFFPYREVKIFTLVSEF